SAPLLRIPDVEALDVKLNGLLVGVRRGNALHHQLRLRDARVAGIALFPVAGTTPESRHAVIRETAVIELASDEETKSFGFHWWTPKWHQVARAASRTRAPFPGFAPPCTEGWYRRVLMFFKNFSHL